MIENQSSVLDQSPGQISQFGYQHCLGQLVIAMKPEVDLNPRRQILPHKIREPARVGNFQMSVQVTPEAQGIKNIPHA